MTTLLVRIRLPRSFKSLNIRLNCITLILIVINGITFWLCLTENFALETWGIIILYPNFIRVINGIKLKLLFDLNNISIKQRVHCYWGSFLWENTDIHSQSVCSSGHYRNYLAFSKPTNYTGFPRLFYQTSVFICTMQPLISRSHARTFQSAQNTF